MRGLPQKALQAFLNDKNLIAAKQMAKTNPELIKKVFAKSASYFNEDKSSGILSFYPQHAQAPFTPIGAIGPWLVTADEKVVYDVGGYGMLGLGHNPPELLEVLKIPQVQANVMTPSIAQSLVSHALFDEIGQTRKDGCPFEKFTFLQSGSEANCLAFRFADANAKKHANGRKLVFVNLERSFHGRTYMATQVTYSVRQTYKDKLASYDTFHKTYSITPNDQEGAQRVFEEIKKNNEYPMVTIIEPIMGEGWVGKQITPEFYKTLYDFTREFNSVLIVDSVQAGFRGNGYLSIVDYPGFQNLEAPDMETWSKCIFAGQYPVSMLALKSQKLFEYGLYGNTMTCNPRGLMITSKVLEIFRTSEFDLRKNIQKQGQNLLEKFNQLQREFPDIVLSTSGTGLLAAMFLNQKVSQYSVEKKVEKQCRLFGLNVIKGSNNALRLTPWFYITEQEIDLIYEIIKESFQKIQYDMEQEVKNSNKDQQTIEKPFLR